MHVQYSPNRLIAVGKKKCFNESYIKEFLSTLTSYRKSKKKRNRGLCHLYKEIIYLDCKVETFDRDK